ncbi:hypothetical protein BKA61DRAFT_569968 [Leptodontidium sp. MPI-SDFR-AT-0119]|nr:hypothetical protein BKA61DRAFT_569968 [Leptodontidium sp. MPI-SDFR-AT-0119]
MNSSNDTESVLCSSRADQGSRLVRRAPIVPHFIIDHQRRGAGGTTGHHQSVRNEFLQDIYENLQVLEVPGDDLGRLIVALAILRAIDRSTTPTTVGVLTTSPGRRQAPNLVKIQLEELEQIIRHLLVDKPNIATANVFPHKSGGALGLRIFKKVTEADTDNEVHHDECPKAEEVTSSETPCLDSRDGSSSLFVDEIGQSPP